MLFVIFEKTEIMKLKIYFLSFLLTMSGLAFSQSDVICIPLGSSVTIDGEITVAEWEDADSLMIGTGSQTKVLFKHDNTSLLVAYLGNLQSSSRFPEILLDINNSKTSDWEADDWWYHVSATDCEFQGEYGNYDSCALVRPNWTAEPNMVSGPTVDTIEIEIPFSTINLDINSVDTVGISVLVTNTFNSWVHWPVSADRNNPSSWAAAIFDCGNVSLEEEAVTEYFDVFPNPSRGILHFEFPDKVPSDDFTISIYDKSGRLLIQKRVKALDEPIIDISALSSGSYLIQLMEENETLGQRQFILNR